MGIQTSLDAVANAERLIDALRLADDLAFEASRDGGVRTLRVLNAALESDDQVVAIAATHAIAQIFDEQADVALSRLLSSERGFLREHAAWTLAARLPRFDTIGRLIGLIVDGGFAGMLAQRTLEKWSAASPEHVGIGLESALLGIQETEARYRVVETLGLVRNPIAARPLMTIATDVTESARVRAAAVSALGQRQGDAQVASILEPMADGDDYLAEIARLALVDFSANAAMSRATPGLTVAQLFLHADVDAGLEQVGRGDNGGIATLLVRLGDALVAQRTSGGPLVERVITMSRGSVSAALESVSDLATARSGHLYGRVPLLSDPDQPGTAWALRVAARRGIRRILRAAGGVDMLHLRMADVGSLAAADVARELDIPVVFTVAPDPHAVIDSLDQSGRLTRQNFGDIDEVEHFWFRTRLVQTLAGNAAHTVLFPRPDLKKDMLELVGIDITAHPERHTIVAEGIDLDVIDRAVVAAAEFASGVEPVPALAALEVLLSRLPEKRRALPLIISVGRLHRVKGMATIVDAWASGPLRDRANLLIVGGDLAESSVDEQEQLALIDARIAPADRLASGLLLPGHQPNNTVAHWVAAVRFGVPGFAAPAGIYVCGSLKEEFGIALLEAMASGLIVVAPDGGGPATYVEQSVTGFLTRTWHSGQLGEAMQLALDAAAIEASDERAARSRSTVEKSFTIQAMARALAEVYSEVQAQEDGLRIAPLASR